MFSTVESGPPLRLKPKSQLLWLRQHDLHAPDLARALFFRQEFPPAHQSGIFKNT